MRTPIYCDLCTQQLCALIGLIKDLYCSVSVLLSPKLSNAVHAA